jgi:hypothetical protein
MFLPVSFNPARKTGPLRGRRENRMTFPTKAIMVTMMTVTVTVMAVKSPLSDSKPRNQKTEPYGSLVPSSSVTQRASEYVECQITKTHPGLSST